MTTAPRIDAWKRDEDEHTATAVQASQASSGVGRSRSDKYRRGSTLQSALLLGQLSLMAVEVARLVAALEFSAYGAFSRTETLLLA